MTAVEQLRIAFRRWQKEWDNFEETRKNKPKLFDEFIKPFLELEKQQIMDANVVGVNCGLYGYKNSEEYYNKTYKNDKSANTK